MQNRDSTQSDKDLRNVIKINEAQIQVHLGQMVRSTVEEVLMENTWRGCQFAASRTSLKPSGG